MYKINIINYIEFFMQNIYFATIEKCINTLNLQEDELIFCGQKAVEDIFSPL